MDNSVTPEKFTLLLEMEMEKQNVLIREGSHIVSVIKSKGRARPFIRKGDDIDLVRFSVTTINHGGESCPSCINEITFYSKW